MVDFLHLGSAVTLHREWLAKRKYKRGAMIGAHGAPQWSLQHGGMEGEVLRLFQRTFIFIPYMPERNDILSILF